MRLTITVETNGEEVGKMRHVKEGEVQTAVNNLTYAALGNYRNDSGNLADLKPITMTISADET